MNLLDHEKLLIERRRRGLTQAEQADFDGVPVKQYCAAELGKIKPAWLRPIHLTPQPWEVCFILRRRSGKSRKQMARKLGVSTVWFTAMEKGHVNYERLTKFWNR